MSHTEHRFCYCRPPRAHIVKYGLNPSRVCQLRYCQLCRPEGVLFSLVCSLLWKNSHDRNLSCLRPYVPQAGGFSTFFTAFFKNIIGLNYWIHDAKFVGWSQVQTTGNQLNVHQVRQASEDIFEHSQPSKSSEPVIKFEFDQLAKVKGS